MDRRVFIAAAVSVGTPLVAGCAGRDGGGGEGVETTAGTTTDGAGVEETPQETTTSTRTPTPGSTTTEASGAQAAYPNYDWEQLAGAEVTETSTVTMRNTAYHPLVARVESGTQVSFPNEDPSIHTVTIPTLDVDELVRTGESTSVTFDELGTFDYVCTFHPPGMLGRIVVE